MAFHQPQRQRPPIPTIYTSSPPQATSSTQPEHYQLSPQQSREWILFTPDSPSNTEARTVSTARTPRTAGRSHLSELGSLDTAAASNRVDEEDAREDEETEDMDSLDDGLHAFHETSLDPTAHRKVHQSAETVLPTHDGLGMFPGSSGALQEQFWQHEKYNPRRRRHSLRKSSLQRRFETLDDVHEQTVEDERFQRIEQWRADQSRAILEEIGRESRRQQRKKKVSPTRTSPQRETPTTEPIAIPNVPQSTQSPSSSPPTESFWERFTRRIIHDLMGFDDATLSLIFGDELVHGPEQPKSAADVMKKVEETTPHDSQLARLSGTWEERLLARIAKELGILVNQLTDHHPGAFSTYLRTQKPMQYAGLPTPPLTSLPGDQTTDSTFDAPPGFSISNAEFTPTLAHQTRAYRQSQVTTDPSLWGIEEEIDQDQRTTEATRTQHEREYWERDLDVKMVFGFLRNRLAPSSQPSASLQPQASASTRAVGGAPESLRRAALIRHHHPLVSRNVAAAASASQQQSASRRANTPLSPVLGRRQGGSRCDESITSCASQSTKRSKTARSGSSRNYWDVGTGSLGSGGWSAGWGEV